MSLSSSLRRELCELNRRYAAAHSCPHVESYGDAGVVIYEPQDRRHGNFLDASYAAILKNDAWRRRLAKVHTHRRGMPRPAIGVRKELDSCTSSDALLMNVFCYPRTLSNARLSGTLGVESDAVPQFGFKARVPLAKSHFDRTEVDLKLGTLLIESKLTESNFQTRSKVMVEGYRDFADVFDRRALPQSRESFLSYQLIRNVLAAHALEMSFCVLLDARRPDLTEAWHAVMRAVRLAGLRTRCKTLTWQELASVLPPRLRRFLAEKYGIHSASAAHA